MNEFWLFLAGLRLFLQSLEDSGRIIIFEANESIERRTVTEKSSFSFFCRVYLTSRFPALSSAMKAVRTWLTVRRQAQLKKRHTDERAKTLHFP